MPFEITPPGAPTPAAMPKLSAAYDWAVKAPYSRDLASFETGGYRPGSLGGGLDYSSILSVSQAQIDPLRYATVAKPPPIVAPAKAPQPFSRLGSFNLNMIDPFTTTTELTGENLGLTTPIIGDRGVVDPMAFLEQKDIGLANAPARLADYAVALPTAVLGKLLGNNEVNGPGDGKLHGMQFKFQADPGYWVLVGRSSDEELQQLATQVAGQYVDPRSNSAFVAKLAAQFKADRAVALGYSSGNEQVDYTAKLYFTHDFISQNEPDPANWGAAQASVVAMAGGYLSAIPFVGTPLAKGLYNIDPRIESEWTRLTPEERKRYFDRAGGTAMVYGLVQTIPLLGGLGAVTAAAKGAGGIAGAAYRAYDTTLRATNWLMAAGVTSAAVTWGLETAFPQASDWLQKNVDGARPISNSSFAGLVNNIGYFSSGTFGVNLAVRSWARVAGKAAGVAGETVEKVAGLRPTVLGARELEFSQTALGGSARRVELAGVGLDPAGLELAGKQTFLSHISNFFEGLHRQNWEAVLRGEQTGIKAIDDLDAAAKSEMANAVLARRVETSQAEALAVVQVLKLAREPRPLNASAEVTSVWETARKMAQWVDSHMTESYLRSYGPEWIARQAGSFTPKAVEGLARRLVTQFGGDGAQLKARGVEEWAQVVRTVHNYGFSKRNAELTAAAEGSTEAARVTLVRNDHIWADQKAGLSAALRGDDAAAASATAARIIRTTEEGADWFAYEWHPKGVAQKSPETANPAALADYLDEIEAGLLHRRGLPNQSAPTATEPLNAFHANLRREGLWEIAFKPTDAEGNAISYIRRPGGSVFKSPWVDYNVTSAEGIELGNRGILGTKFDAVFRGFRTYRITEFQKGMLFRSLTGRFDFTPDQVTQFYDRLLTLARENAMQPQTAGAMARSARIIPGAYEMKQAIEKIAEQTFGKGPYIARDGQPVQIDWGTEISQSFVQSYRLNVAAGLTSHLKAHLGEPGAAMAWASDVGYVMWRFNLSPLFKGGELEESMQLNAMRGVTTDPIAEALYFRSGVGNDYGPLNQELAFDPKVQGAVGLGGIAQTATHRDAAGLAFYARLLPEDLRLKQTEAAVQQPAGAWRDTHLGGNLPTQGAPDPALRTGGDPIVRTGRVVRQEDFPVQSHTLDAADFPEAKDWYDPTGDPTDRGLWHATTAMDRVMAEGLRPGAETGNMGLGPGIKVSDRQFVSVTGRWEAAQVIAERLKMAIRASRNEVSATDILDHFAPDFMDDYLAMGEALGIHNPLGWSALETAAKRQYKTGPAKYQMVQELDMALGRMPLDNGEVSGHVGLTATVEMMAKLDPEQVGIVQVGAARTARPQLGQDPFELRFNHTDLMVLDDRPPLAPLPADEAGLFAELRATLQRGDPTRPVADSEMSRIVGEQGVVPGLDARAAAIVERLRELRAAKVDGGPTFRWEDTPLDQQVAFKERLHAEGWSGVSGSTDLNWQRTGLDGVTEQRTLPELWDHAQRQAGAADNMAQVAGTTEALFDNVLPRVAAAEAKKGGKAAQAWDTFWHPAKWKMEQAKKLQIELMRREFPALVRMAKLDGVEQVYRGLGLPEKDWSTFLLRDRELAQRWWESNDPADLARLFSHTKEDAALRAKLDALYATEDWQVLSGLWAINLRTAQEEAFGVHFFSPYRSAFERSVNHPLLGIYPASWALKVAREWALFLYDNRTFGNGSLRLGMYPMQAIAAIVHQQESTFAQENPDTLDHWLYKGPLGSPIFIFNLLLPGDWSALPFPMTRTIRDLIRPALNGDVPAAGQVLTNQLANMGMTRDLRLITQSLGELGSLLATPKASDPSLVLRGHSVLGTSAPDWWNEVSPR